MNGKSLQNIHLGQHVEIIQKQDQHTGELTNGFIKKILTKTSFHPHGIKVELETGEIGRVKNILSD